MTNIDPNLAHDLSRPLTGVAKGLVGSFKFDSTLFNLEPGNQVPVLAVTLIEMSGRKIETAIPPDLIVQMTATMLSWLAQMEVLQQQAMLAAWNNDPANAKQAAADLIQSTKKAGNK